MSGKFIVNLQRFSIVTLLVICCINTFAQESSSKKQTCIGDYEGEWNNYNNGRSSCEWQEQTLPATGAVIQVDGKQNGGLTIRGWARQEILVRAKVQGRGNNAQEARETAAQVRIETAGLHIFAVGPESRDNRWWSVSFEIFVPQKSDLTLITNNGGIGIFGVRGNLNFTANNGALTLHDLGGKVQGKTTNGSVSIQLAGLNWEGESLDVSTTNGSVNVSVPENYSAHLEARAYSGSFKFDFPVTLPKPFEREVVTDLGNGGVPLRIRTINGSMLFKTRR
jgi:hypothetical protein